MTILYEDNHIIAVNKTCNEIVQGDKTGDVPLSEMVKSYIKDKYHKPGEVFLGVTHRLDRPTSGVVLFARTSKALARLNEMFRSHTQIRKTYWAIVEHPERLKKEGERLEDYLVRNEKLNKSFVGRGGGAEGRGAEGRHGEAEGQRAVLSYKPLGYGEHYALVEVELETGRHHQIRCQMAHIGCPIKGDLKYGARRSNKDGGICLHARRIQFTHPVSHVDIDITAPAPNEFNLYL